MDGELYIPIYNHKTHFLRKNIFKSNKNIYSELVSQLLNWLVPLQIIEVHQNQRTIWMLDGSTAVQWKHHILWNPTIPQDKKFLTVITKLPGPCSSQSHTQRSRNLIQIYSRQWHVWKTEETEIQLLDIIIHKVSGVK